MQPIINPKIFYLISMLSNIRTLAFITIAIISAVLIFKTADILINNDYSKVKQLCADKIIKIPFILTLIILMLGPAESTLIALIISQHITTGNINSVKGQIFEIVDYIVKNLK